MCSIGECVYVDGGLEDINFSTMRMESKELFIFLLHEHNSTYINNNHMLMMVKSAGCSRFCFVRLCVYIY